MSSDRLLPALLIALIIGIGVFFGVTQLMGGDAQSGQVGTIASFLSIGIFLTVFLAMQSGADKFDISRRVQLVRGEGKKTTKSTRSRHADRIVEQDSTMATRAAQSIIRYLGISGDKMPAVKLELMRAGFIGSNALFYYTIAKVSMPIVGLIAGFSYGIYSWPDEALYIGISTIGGALTASFLIDVFLRSRARQRHQIIWEDFPDAIDLMVIYTETGATLDTALPRIVSEIKDTSEELAQEFIILSTELRLQTDRAKAYDNLLKRVDMPSIKTFVSIVKQSENIGSPVTKALSSLSSELRRERMLIAERRAARIPVLITLPLMVCIMPALFMIVLGPTAIRIIDIVAGWGF